MRVINLGSLICLFVGMGACAAPNSLSGSIGESFSLDFDQVQIRRQDDTVLVEYLSFLNNGATEKVVKLVFEDTELLNLASTKKVSGDQFLQHVTVSRVANSGGDFPPIKTGRANFRKFKLADGSRVDGDFEIVFEVGRTLSGTFDGSLQEVDTQ
ncbi:MAG: hypothetical protein R3C68_14380 [Myxococcota bacterium]